MSSARLRWKFLSEAVVQKTCEVQNCNILNEDQRDGERNENTQNLANDNRAINSPTLNAASTRRFTDFGLFDHDPVLRVGLENCIMYSLQSRQTGECPNGSEQHAEQSLHCVKVLISAPEPTTIEDVKSFDNTGNICVWPSEQVLAYICAKKVASFSGKRICELGGGMTCLAGHIIAAGADASAVLLTDGNLKSTQMCMRTERINRQNRLYRTLNVATRHLRWDQVDDYRDLIGSFDLIIAADCLFIAEFRDALADCIYNLLTNEGTAWIVAPRRQNVLTDFISIAEKRFIVQVSERHDMEVWRTHEHFLSTHNADYVPDLHYPLLLTLRKRI